MNRIPLFFWILLSPMFVNAQVVSDTLNKLDAAGKKHGYWKKYDGDTLRYEGRFEHGIPTGDFVYYYFDKTVKARTHYSENGVKATTVMYFPSGAKLSEGIHINQKREGVWLNYDGYENVISRVEYKNGEKNGLSIVYYQDGVKLEVANYANGLREGAYAQYFPDSVIKIRGFYTADKRNGIFAFYHANGLVYQTGKYVNNLREGDWMTYDEEGKAVVKETYKNGTVVSREVYQKEKDPEYLKQKESENDMKNRGKTTDDNGINDARYDGY